MFLTKSEDGHFHPSYPKDKEDSSKIRVGEEVRVTKARNAAHHRKFFAVLTAAFENQSKFTDPDIYRQIILMKAGHVVFVPGTDGKDHPLPKSIAFDNLGQLEFEKLYDTCLVVLAADIGVSVAELEQNSKEYM